MADIFISYVEEDADVVEPLARGLIETGYSCWYYQRSSLPGASYLQQISDALSQAKVVLLVLSLQTLDSHQVDKEISFAHECNKPFLPITRNLAWGDFQQRRPTWRLAVGTSVAIPILFEGAAAILPRVIDGLRGLGIHSAGALQPQPVGGPSAASEPRQAASSTLGAPAASPLPWARRLVSEQRAAPDALPARTALVGRTKELGFLRTEYDAVLADEGGRLVFISGEPGVGKTRLAQEVGLYAWSKGGAFLEGTYLRDGSAPYAPWVDALRSSLRVLGRDQLGALGGGLGQLFPGLAEPFDRDPAATFLPAEERRRLLFDTLAEAIAVLSRRTPLVLVLNDLQWAPGLAPLVHVARRLTESRALILGTYREQEFKEQPALMKDWSELNRARLATQLSLHPLSAAETDQLAAQYVGAEPARQLSELLYRRTHGNAFFLEEVLRSLVETGAVRVARDGWEIADISRISVPDSMRLVVEERVGRLGPGARDLLTLAAVLGQEFSFRLLLAITGKSEGEALDVVEAAMATYLLVDRSVAGEERYAFADDQVQEVLYTSVLAPRRRRAHLRAAQALEVVYAGKLDAHLEELAHHFLQGDDLEKACAYAIEAGERAFALGAWPRAARHFETALGLIEELPPDLARKAQVLERLADLDIVTAFSPGLEYARRALDLYTELGDSRRAARMHRSVARAWVTGTTGQVNWERARPHYEAGVELLESTPDSAEKASAVSGLAFWHALSAADFERAIAVASEASAIAERLNDPDQVAQADTALGLAHAFRGDLVAAERHVERSWEAALRGKEPWIKIVAPLYPVLFWPWRHDREWAERWLGSASELQRRSHVERYDRPAYQVKALVAAFSGRPAEAEQALRLASEVSKQRPATYYSYFSYFAGSAYAILGDRDQAERLLSESLRTSDEGVARSQLVETCSYYGRFLLGVGDFVRAELVLAHGQTLARQHGSLLQELALLPALVEVYAESGRTARAKECVERAQGILARPQPWRGLAALSHRAAGILAAAMGDWREAERSFEWALTVERTYGFLYHEAHVLVPWAELYLQCNQPGDRERGLEKLDQALVIFEQCQAKRDIERVLTRKAAVV